MFGDFSVTDMNVEKYLLLFLFSYVYLNMKFIHHFKEVLSAICTSLKVTTVLLVSHTSYCISESSSSYFSAPTLSLK